MKRTLFAVLAALTLCVTMTIVCPLSLIALKSPRSSSVDLESSAPLGSSARISCGCVIKARATAALCFCPPDTSYGYLFRSLLIPSCSAIGAIRLSISVYFFPDRTSGRKILSFFPPVGLSSAARIFRSVVLPLPLSPIIATYSPASTEKLTLCSAST